MLLFSEDCVTVYFVVLFFTKFLKDFCRKPRISAERVLALMLTVFGTSRRTSPAYILEKLHACSFFDDEVRPSIFYLTLHDAMLAILEKHPEASEKSSHLEKVSLAVHLFPAWALACA